MSKFGGFFVVSMEGVRIVRVEQKTSWWLNQPHLKNLSQNGNHIPNFRGENKTYLKPPPSRLFFPLKRLKII